MATFWIKWRRDITQYGTSAVEADSEEEAYQLLDRLTDRDTGGFERTLVEAIDGFDGWYPAEDEVFPLLVTQAEEEATP